MQVELKRNAELVKELILQGAEVRRLLLQLEMEQNHVSVLEKQMKSRNREKDQKFSFFFLKFSWQATEMLARNHFVQQWNT